MGRDQIRHFLYRRILCTSNNHRNVSTKFLWSTIFTTLIVAKTERKKDSGEPKKDAISPHFLISKETDNGTGATTSKPQSILIARECIRSEMSDMNELAGWREEHRRTPSQGSRALSGGARSVHSGSWADCVLGGTQKFSDATTVSDRVPEITANKDRKHAAHLRITKRILSQKQAIKAKEGSNLPVDDPRSCQAQQLIEDQKRLSGFRASRYTGREDTLVNSASNALSTMQAKAGGDDRSRMKGTNRSQLMSKSLGKSAHTVSAGDGGHDDVGTQNFKAGLRFIDEGDYESAKVYFLSCLKWRYTKLGQDHIDVCLAREQLGNVMVRLGEVEEAHWQYLLSLQVMLVRLGKQNFNVVRITISLGDVYFNSGSYGRALKHYEKCLCYRAKQLGHSYDDMANICVERCVRTHMALGRCALQNNELDMTLFHCREVLWLSRLILRGNNTSSIIPISGNEDKDIESAMMTILEEITEHKNIVGGIKLNEVKCSYLTELMQLLVANKAKFTGEDIATVIEKIAFVHYKKNELENVHKCYQEKLEFMNKELPQERVDLADTSYALGNISTRLGYHTEAIDFFSYSLATYKQLGRKGTGKGKVAAVLSCLCKCHLAVKNLTVVLQLYQEYLETGSCGDAAEVLSTMGLIFCKLYDLPNAIRCYMKCLKADSMYGSDTEKEDNFVHMIKSLQVIFLTGKNFGHDLFCYEKVRDTKEMKTIVHNLALTQLERFGSQNSRRLLQDLQKYVYDDDRMEKVDLSIVFLYMGNVLFRRCHYSESVRYYEQCLCLNDYLSGVHPQDLVDLLTNIGTAYFKVGESDKSYLYFKRALQELENAHVYDKKGPADSPLSTKYLSHLLQEAKTE